MTDLLLIEFLVGLSNGMCFGLIMMNEYWRHRILKVQRELADLKRKVDSL